MRTKCQEKQGDCPIKTPSSFTSTIDSFNRVRDAEIVKDHIGLAEKGDDKTKFVSARNENSDVLATGYVRVVYGDHGPYVEFDKQHIDFSKWPNVKKKSDFAYYDERFTEDKKIMLYVQKKSVEKVPNPLRKGKFSVFNNRAEGYADYKPGMHYVSVLDLELAGKEDEEEVEAAVAKVEEKTAKLTKTQRTEDSASPT